LFGKLGSVRPLGPCQGEDATVGLLFFGNVMLDLLAKHRDLGDPESIANFALKEIIDQQLGAVVLHLRFIEQLFVGLPGTTRRIENFLLQDGVDDELDADLLDQLILATVLRGGFKVSEELLHAAVIQLQRFDRASLGGRSCLRRLRVRVDSGCSFL